MCKEFWRDIADYEGLYQVSNYGRVKSLSRFLNHSINECLLKPIDNGNNYLNVRLHKEGHYTTKYIHRIMMEAFVPNPHNYPQVNHKDEDKQNNFIWVNDDGTVDLEKSNLEWCTTKYNINYGKHNEKVSEGNKGEKICQYTLSGEFIKEWSCSMEIEKTLGIAHNWILNVCKHKKRNRSAHKFLWEFKGTSPSPHSK